MAAWLVRRVAASVAIVFAVVTLTFFLMAVAPGEPLLGPDERPADPQVRAELRRQFGLDQGPLVRYVKYLGQMARGNFGESFSLHRPVADALAEAIPNTLLLAGACCSRAPRCSSISCSAWDSASTRRSASTACRTSCSAT